MKFLIGLIWILLLGKDGLDMVQANEDYSNQNIDFSMQIPLNIRIEAIVEPGLPTNESIYTTTFHDCVDKDLKFNYPFKNFIFNSFCTMKYPFCWRHVDYFKDKYDFFRSGRTLLLLVESSVSENSNVIRIITQRCEKDSIIINFKRDNLSLKDRQKYDTYYSWTPNLNRYDNCLYIRPTDKELTVDVVLNITVPGCSKVNEKYCKHLCRNNTINPKIKCTIKIENKYVRIENKDTKCINKGIITKTMETLQRVGNGMCEYFRLNNIRPCEHICIDMPGCSFMCVQEYESQITEMGYQESVLLDHYGFVGSGRWSAADIPNHLVLVDECRYNSKLCMNPASCRDKIKGYECINGEYNMVGCIINRKSRFWHCPANQSSYNNSTPSSIDSFVYSFYEIAKQKMNLEIKLPKMFSELSNQYKAFKTWNSSTRRDVSGYVLKEIENVFQRYSVQTLNKDNFHYEQNTDSFDAYSSVLRKTDEEHRIPIMNIGSSKEIQFVKFNIRDNDIFASSNQNLISNFIRYKDLDMMGESDQIDSKVKIKGIFEKSGFNVSAKDFVERYKNSDVIYLALNQNRNVTIKFKLKSKFKHTSPSWLYSFEDECGFLDKEKSWEWSVEGCSKKWLSDKDYYCECDHLSNFAMLFSMKRVNVKHLIVFRYLSVIGATINIISLILFLIFVLLINSRDKLRLDQLNIAICLLLGTFVFLMGKYTSRNITLCKLTALSTQFLFLSAFIWKLILGINVVRMITSMRYQNQDSKQVYRLAAISVSYGVPFIITIFSGGFHWVQYGKISDEVCWIQSSSNAFLTFLIPIGIILAVNLLILFFIASTFICNYIKTHKTKVNGSNELLVFLQLVVAMGLTWLPSYLATIYLAAMYLWVIFFPLQGLMMFLFVVVINRENREKVSTFILQRYSSLMSQSVIITNTSSFLKSRSSNECKTTEQSQGLISPTDKENNPSNYPMGVMTDPTC